ncbi:hypothetical protein ACNRC9_21715 [Ralstonia pseudosolanacearum]|uniref:hypothetical protein n=1 Tax=Ralstonia pseudosolanacearum TaxID=1310165 RepID=UPI003AAF2B27
MNYPFSGIIVRYLLAGGATSQTETAGDAFGKVVSHTESISDDKNKRPGDQLHVNLWDMAGRQYLDIGVMVSNPSATKEVWVDIPWKLNEESVIDLGAKLDGEKMITAIFNELAEYTGESEKEYANVKLELNNGEERHFFVVRLARRHFNFEYQPMPIGSTRIKIGWPSREDEGVSPTKALYLRIRVRSVPPDVFFSTFRQRDRNLLSSTTITRLFDFRVNVRRGIPDEILLGEQRLQFPQFEKIHLFAIVDRGIELAFHSGNFKGSRSLEDEGIWNSYLDLTKNKKRQRYPDTVRDYLGYQWTASGKTSQNAQKKRAEPAKDLVALGRFAHVVSSRWNNGRFMIVVILLGACGSALWDLCKAVFWSDDDRPGAPVTLHIALRLAFLLVVISSALLADRDTAYSIIGMTKGLGQRLSARLRSWWEGIEPR